MKEKNSSKLKINDKYTSEISRNDARRLEQAKCLINDLKSNGPGGLIAVAGLSSLLKRVIKIWLPNGHLVHTIGTSHEKRAINIEYERSERNNVGHWVSKGGLEPSANDIHLNGCLFAAVAAQVGGRAIGLRIGTVRLLKKKLKVLAAEMDRIVHLTKVGKLMLGGAKYAGRGPNDASVILDNSQNVYCSGCSQPGHPRGHASCPEATGQFDSAENYSRTGRKSAFLSRDDQNKMAHFTLLHQQTQNALRTLNTGSESVAVTVDALELGVSNMPQGKEFYMGNPVSNAQNIQKVTMVLRHHPGKVQEPEADVFVHTFYPRLN